VVDRLSAEGKDRSRHDVTPLVMKATTSSYKNRLNESSMRSPHHVHQTYPNGCSQRGGFAMWLAGSPPAHSDQPEYLRHVTVRFDNHWLK
jgi:hypothetical protein